MQHPPQNQGTEDKTHLELSVLQRRKLKLREGEEEGEVDGGGAGRGRQ